MPVADISASEPPKPNGLFCSFVQFSSVHVCEAATMAAAGLFAKSKKVP
jgi:hypothetical protein